MKFYVTLQKVHTLSPDNVRCSFTNKSLELTVYNLDDKDYIFTINKLLKPIDPERSSWKVKSGKTVHIKRKVVPTSKCGFVDMVIINAAKVEEVSWSHVTELEKRASDAKKVIPETDKSEDPSEGLMSIMRTM